MPYYTLDGVVERVRRGKIQELKDFEFWLPDQDAYLIYLSFMKAFRGIGVNAKVLPTLHS